MIQLSMIQHSRSFLLATIFAASLTASSPAVGADLSDADFQKMMDGYISKEENVEKLAGVIMKNLQQRQQKDRQRQAEEEARAMEDQFKNPLQVEIGKSPVKGNPNAKVTIFEFSDFECPYCQRGAENLEQVAKMYPNDVKIVFKHYPLPFHKAAIPASKAAMAAGVQGKFWEMHEKLFSNQENLTPEGFIAHATALGLDIEKFKSDMANPEFQKQIESDMEQGKKVGISGTPGFIVNGVRVTGAQPPEAFKRVIDRHLNQK